MRALRAAERDEEARAAWRARAPLGERAVGSVPRNRGPNTTVIASITVSGHLDGAAMMIEGATDKVRSAFR